MGLMFVLFFNTGVLGGLAYHEIAGLVFAVMYFTHILLNLSWVKNVTVRIFDRKLPWKTRGSYLLNFLLLISMTFVIISGIMISRVVFPNINIGNKGWFKVTHEAVSYFVLLLVGIHVGLHWHWIVSIWKKIWRFRSQKKWLGIVAKIVTVLILVFGGYEIKQTGFINRVASTTSVFNMSNSQMEGGIHGPMGGKFNSGTRPAFKSFQSSTESKPTNFSGKPQGNFGGGGHDGGNANVLNVILTYTGVLSVFVIVSYYIRKMTGKRRKLNRA